jgi:hypothetical protein
VGGIFLGWRLEALHPFIASLAISMRAKVAKLDSKE